LGHHLKKRRLELGLFQKQVARALDISEWTYLGWEHDRKSPVISFWPRIIRFLGYDPNPESTTLGEQITSKRRQLGLSQVRAAKLVGVDVGTFRCWESGELKSSLKLSK